MAMLDPPLVAAEKQVGYSVSNLDEGLKTPHNSFVYWLRHVYDMLICRILMVSRREKKIPAARPQDSGCALPSQEQACACALGSRWSCSAASTWGRARRGAGIARSGSERADDPDLLGIKLMLTLFLVVPVRLSLNPPLPTEKNKKQPNASAIAALARKKCFAS